MSYQAIREKLRREEVVILDGGVGTEILRRGVYWRCHGIEQHPEVVRQVHADYITAGADVVRTNTFQLNRRAYLNLFHGLEHMRHIGPEGLERKAGELAQQAVQLALEARQRSGRGPDVVAIAGVISPLEHSFRPDLSPPSKECHAEHAEMAALMKSAGADFILFESMNTVSEAEAACQAARDCALPVWVSFVVREDGRLLSKEPLGRAAKVVERLGADVVLVNCAPPADITRALAVLCKHYKGPVGSFAHIGRYDPPSWKFGFYPRFSGTDAFPPDRYVRVAKQWRRLGAQVIGGCCGTTPEHIRAIREMLGNE